MRKCHRSVKLCERWSDGVISMDISDLKPFELDVNAQVEFMGVLGFTLSVEYVEDHPLAEYLNACLLCDQELKSLPDPSELTHTELAQKAYAIYHQVPLMRDGFNSVISKDKRRPSEVLTDRYELKKYGKIAQHAQKCRSKYLKQGEFEQHLSQLRKGEGLWNVEVALRTFKIDKMPAPSLDKYQNILNQLIIFKGIRGAHLIYEFLRLEKISTQQIKALFKEWKANCLYGTH